LIAAFAVLQVVAIGFSDKILFSLQRVIAAEINWTCIFFISAYVFLKRGRPTLWAALLCATTVPVILIVTKEHALGQLPWAGHIPSFLKVEDESVQRILAGARRDGGDYRVQGPFSTPLGLGEYMALTVPFLLHFVVGPFKMWIRLLCAAILPFAINVVLWSDSRLGLIGCILSFVLFGLLYGIFWWRRHRETIIGPAIVLAYPAVMATVFAATLIVGRIRERIWGSGQYEASNEGRSEMYRVGIPMVLKHPWGYGPGRGAETLGITNLEGVITIDTYYMLIALEYGIIGFFLYYGAMAIAIWTAGRDAVTVSDRKSEEMLLIPLVVAMTNFFIIKSVFSNDDNHPLVYMMMGMILALVWRHRHTAKPANDAIPAPSPPARTARRAR
jgi:hypothetical protein